MKVIIIGGGASGVIHALYLRKLNKDIEITILEKNDRILKKLLKTGNGRCNISNMDIDPKYYNNYRFIEEVYQILPPPNIWRFFEELGIIFRTDFSSRLYPYSDSAKTVVDTLRYELDNNNINVLCNEEVVNISKDELFRIKTSNNTYHADILVVAAGSIAQEQTNIYDLLKKLSHNSTNLNPGLVPLRVQEDLRSLQGIRIKCRASIVEDGSVKYSEDGELLFKDRGVSGVLVLNLSRHISKQAILRLDLFYDYPEIEKYISSFIKTKDILTILANLLPKMLAQYIVKKCDNDISLIIQTIRKLEFTIIGDYGFSIGQIVRGGVLINNINSDFSSKLMKDLYIIGEVLDIDGASGGYNLHFAWTSGIISARSIFEKYL